MSVLGLAALPREDFSRFQSHARLKPTRADLLGRARPQLKENLFST